MKLRSLFLFCLVFCALLGGCANAPVGQQTALLLNDRLFTPSTVRISADDVFSVSPEMRRYVNVDIADQIRAEGRQQGLFNALYRKDQLKLEYDSALTRTAAQAFAARSGNCLSLTIMTAAFAKELGMSVRFHRVFMDEAWNRTGDIYFASGHVNLTLGRKMSDLKTIYDETHLMTIDFYPVGEMEIQHAWTIGEKTILAMYMNNRAAETLVQGNVNDAYWWAREAVMQDPTFLNSYNTLGIIYRRHGNLHEAEQVLNYYLKQEPENPQTLSNMILVLNDQGRTAEAEAMNTKLLHIEPYPPYYYFNLGQKAMRDKDFKAARDLFTKEVGREPVNPEFHFWLAAAYIGLGDLKQAQEHLTSAMENSSTRHDHDLYAAKLDRIKSYSTPVPNKWN